MTTFSPPRLPFPPRATRAVAITNATVVPLDRDGTLAAHTVVVRDGVIETLAASTAVDTSDMEVIDGRGKFVVPALSDMHVHIRDQSDAALFLANGVTHVRNMWGRPAMFAWQQRVADGALPGPRVATTSPLVDGVGDDGMPIWPGSMVLTDPARASDLVARFARRGYRELKAYSWLSRDVFVALCRAAAEHGLRVTGHCPEGITFEEAMEAGQRCFEHLTAFAYGHLKGGAKMPSLRSRVTRNTHPEAIRLIGQEVDWDSVRRLAHEMARRGAWICPTVVVWERQGQTVDEAVVDAELRHVSGMGIGWRRAMEGRRPTLGMPEIEWVALARGRTEAHARATAIMHGEGVSMILGTDTPNPWVVPGFSVHRETALLAGAGITPLDVLRCATVEAARYRGESDAAGTVTAGKRADLLLLDGDPTTDVAALRRIEAVLVNGFVLDRKALAASLDAAVALERGSEAGAPTLDPAPADRTLEGEGTLAESTGGAPAATIAYRHSRSGDGTVLVEEEQLSHSERRTRRFELAPDLTLRSAQWETETWLGRETGGLSWRDGEYVSTVEEIDGRHASGRLASAPLLPAPRLSATIWPRLFATRAAPSSAETVDLSVDTPVRARVSLERGEAGPDVTWSVRSADSPTPATYRLRKDGSLVEAVMPVPFAPRTLRPR